MNLSFYTLQDHKLDFNSTARVPLKDLVNTVMGQASRRVWTRL